MSDKDSKGELEPWEKLAYKVFGIATSAIKDRDYLMGKIVLAVKAAWPRPITPKEELISVEERLPEKNGEYLTWDGNIYYCDDFVVSGKFWNSASSHAYNVTHWQPLPSPPVIEPTKREAQ